MGESKKKKSRGIGHWTKKVRIILGVLISCMENMCRDVRILFDAAGIRTTGKLCKVVARSGKILIWGAVFAMSSNFSR